MNESDKSLKTQLKKTQKKLDRLQSSYPEEYLKIKRAHSEWVSALDKLEDLIFIHDKNFCILRCNYAYQQQAGLPYSQIIGHPYYDIFPKNNTRFHRCLSGMQNSESEENQEVLEIGDLTYRLRAYAVRDEDQSYMYSVCILEDITEWIKAKRVLKESEEKFHSITATAQDAIIIMNDKGNITYWNEAATKMFGYTQEEAIGKELHPLLAPERFLEAHRKGFKHFVKTGKGPDIGKIVELTALKKDGEEFPVELSLAANKKDGRWEAIGIVRDITKRKEDEVLLQQEKEFSERVLDTAPAIILVMDKSGKIVTFNRYMETLSGYSLSEIKGADWFSIFLPEEEREETKALFLGAINDIQTMGNVSTLLIKDGSKRQIEWYDKTLKDKDGHTIGLLSIGADVTERKILEDERKLFRTLLDYSNDAIEVLDAKTLQFIDVNETSCRDLGYSRDELLSMSIREIDPSIGEDQLKKLAKVLRDEGSTIIESTHRRKDGSTFPVEISISAVHFDKNYRIAVVRDITERKQAEEAIRRTNRALKTLSAGNKALVLTQSEDELLKRVTDVIVEEGGYSLAVVDYANDDPKKSIIPMAWSGCEGEFCLLKEVSWSETSANQIPVSKAIRTATVQVTQDISQESEFELWRDTALSRGFTSSIAFPLMDGDKAFGALNIYASEVNAFAEEEEVRLLEELANDLAYGICTIRIRTAHEQQAGILRESLIQSIQTISATVESRDPYTAGHQQRVSELATTIAKDMALSKDQVMGINLAASIHDLGKMQIPSEILSKPGKLSNIEYMLIKTHPQAGYSILKDVKFPWPIADIILQHHERLDGSGYPQGLKGDKILLEAKIIAVADVVEAISSHRPYRAALGIEAALEEIRKNRGTLYEARIVDACIKLFKKKKFTFSD